MCAKLYVVAASNNRDHMPWSLCYCLFVPHIYGCCFLRTSRSWLIAHSTQRQRRGCNSSDLLGCNEQLNATHHSWLTQVEPAENLILMALFTGVRRWKLCCSVWLVRFSNECCAMSSNNSSKRNLAFSFDCKSPLIRLRFFYNSNIAHIFVTLCSLPLETGHHIQGCNVISAAIVTVNFENSLI